MLLRLFLVVLALLVSPSLALGHAALTSSVPEDGAVLAELPGQVELRFSEAVTPLSVAVARPDGAVQAVSAEGVGTLLRFTMPAGSAGTYLVIYRVVSEDGHPVGGTLAFSKGQQTRTVAAQLASATSGIPALLLLVNGLAYFATFVVIGTAVTLFAAPDRRPAPYAIVRLCNVCGVLGLLALGLSWLLQGADLTGISGLPLLEARAWQAPFSSPAWWRVPVLIAALCVGWWSATSNVPAGIQGPTAVLALLLALGALLSTGHSATAISPWTMRATLLVHLLGIIAWFGPLPLLAFALWRQGLTALEPLARYSKYVPIPITMIVASGAVLAVLQMGWPGPQWGSPYGAVLTTKLAFLAIITGLAWHNRYRLTKPTLAGDHLSQRRLARSILLEIGLTLLVLLSVAAWRFTPPPVAMTQSPHVTAPFEQMSGRTHLHSSQVMAGLTIEAAGAGLHATLDLQDSAGHALRVQSVDLRLTVPDPALPPLQLAADSSGEGTWSVTLPGLPPGRWAVVATVRIDDFTQVTLKGGIRVEPDPKGSAPQ
jgi:copper transport protein